MDHAKPAPGKQHLKDVEAELGAHDTGAHAAVEDDEETGAQLTLKVLRCPYCHDGCGPDEAVACRDCLARHHAACWDEGGRCGSCSSTHKLVAEAPRQPTVGELIDLLRRGKSQAVRVHFESLGATPQEAFQRTAELAFKVLAEVPPEAKPGLLRSPGAPSALCAAQAGLLLLAGGVALVHAGVAVTVGGLTLAIATIFQLAIYFAGRRAPRLLAAQAGLTLAAIVLVPAVINAWKIRPTSESPELGGVGLVLAATAALCALACRPRAPGDAPPPPAS